MFVSIPDLCILFLFHNSLKKSNKSFCKLILKFIIRHRMLNAMVFLFCLIEPTTTETTITTGEKIVFF